MRQLCLALTQQQFLVHTSKQGPRWLPLACYALAHALQQVQVIVLQAVRPGLHAHQPSSSCQLLNLLLAVLVAELNTDQLPSCNRHSNTACRCPCSCIAACGACQHSRCAGQCDGAVDLGLVVGLMPPKCLIVQAEVVKVCGVEAAGLVSGGVTGC